MAYKWLIILLLSGIAAWYYLVDPVQWRLFPSCPSLSLGLLCPLCGGQRALHHVLHGDVAGAWHYNPLLLLFIPYGCLWLLMEWKIWTSPRLQALLFGPTAIRLWLIAAAAFTILRNWS